MAFGKRVDGPGGRRRASRNPAAIRAEMKTPAEWIDVMLIDMSSTGAKLHGPYLPPEGQVVLVRIGPLEAMGTVVWSEPNLCGIRFDTPASDDDVGLLQREPGLGTLTAVERRNDPTQP